MKALRERVFRRPASPHSVTLHVRPLGSSSRPRRWELKLVAGDGSVRQVAGQPAVVWLSGVALLRRNYRERLRALRAEGWIRVA